MLVRIICNNLISEKPIILICILFKWRLLFTSPEYDDLERFGYWTNHPSINI